jgi:hypothetical protein
MLTPVRDIGEAILTSLTVFITGLLALLAAIVLVVVGWILAGWVGTLLARLLRRLRFEDLVDRLGADAFLRRARVRSDASGLVGTLATWYLRIVVVLVAANVVGLTAVSSLLSQLLGFIPNALVALLIVAAAAWLGDRAREWVGGALEGARLPNARLIGTITQIAVIAFGVVAAANQVGIAATVVNTLFIGVVAALALAFGLAFGLGGRDVASEFLRDWRQQAETAIERAQAPKALTEPEPTEAGRAAPGTESATGRPVTR